MEQLGFILKDNGMTLALAADDITEWKRRFDDAARYLASTGAPFTSEDVTSITGLPRNTGTNANNAVGAMMNALARKGVIRKTGERKPSRRPSSHGAELTAWRGTSSIGDT